MPHKRAKSSVRAQTRDEKGTDLAPRKSSLQNEAIPKSAARILNAHTIREEWKLKKRKKEEDGNTRDGKRRKTGPHGTTEKEAFLTIKPGESIQHFNKRVEDDLRPLIKSAVETSRAIHRRTETQEREAKAEAKKAKQQKDKTKSAEKSRESPSPSLPPDKHADRPKEFAIASSSAPKRLNDIAQAPPEFKKLPRGASSSIGKKDGILSMSQQLMMEKEREMAIARYRELKASKRQASAGDKLNREA